MGDYVVHVDHGIGVFVGLKQLGVAPGEAPQEFMELRYSGEDKLFVPVERLDLVQKYTGASRPPVDRLGGQTWEKAKTRVKKAMRDMAEELLKLYAQRKAVPGHAFAADTHWQEEFEGAFPYEPTVDQSAAIPNYPRVAGNQRQQLGLHIDDEQRRIVAIHQLRAAGKGRSHIPNIAVGFGAGNMDQSAACAAAQRLSRGVCDVARPCDKVALSLLAARRIMRPVR